MFVEMLSVLFELLDRGRVGTERFPSETGLHFLKLGSVQFVELVVSGDELQCLQIVGALQFDISLGFAEMNPVHLHLAECLLDFLLSN